jgi:hypothetical protein
MNLSTDQLIFLAAAIGDMTKRAQEDPLARIEGKFNIRLEWTKKNDARGEYILRGVQEENVTRA